MVKRSIECWFMSIALALTPSVTKLPRPWEKRHLVDREEAPSRRVRSCRRHFRRESSALLRWPRLGEDERSRVVPWWTGGLWKGFRASSLISFEPPYIRSAQQFDGIWGNRSIPNTSAYRNLVPWWRRSMKHQVRWLRYSDVRNLDMPQVTGELSYSNNQALTSAQS